MKYSPSDTRYDQAPYARCGRSGLRLPRISLGFWQNFGKSADDETGRAIARRAFDLGVTHFDLANNYGPPPGAAEKALGRILKKDLGPWRDELIIATKAGYEMWPGPYGDWGSRKHLLASLDQSLRRLDLDYVDIFYSHRRDSDTPLEETMNALAHAVRQGKALYIGLSKYSPDDTQRAAAILRSLGAPCVICQPRYSLLHREIESGLLETLQTEGIGCIVFSPLAQGQLTDRYLAGIPPDSRAARDHTLNASQIEANLPTVRALHEVAQARGQSLAQMALAWTLRLPAVTSALAGASSLTQLENNVRALDRLDFSGEELARIDAILRRG